ncbi:glyoxalase [Lentzea sp. NBRC 105346]|uniref:VOC family protein n=1 Tax=Lentzea sp. NBRC 105346 TaxID=3032205 RepID=UPI0024A00873|nr:VOC family protein [Lentzea sp. NBRC 105346]GLZ36326.1 glyoxalase [Lentzea sp. NBRC 105346]
MACRITELVLDCTDPELLANFWCAVLDFRVTDRDESGVAIGPADRRFELLFLRSDEPKKQKLRLHIDVSATDRDQQSELERLLALGAQKIDIGQGEQSWHVLADPEGNEFCLLRRRVTP